MIIDNYALSNFQSCPAKYDLRMRQRWTARRKGAALGFGGALHHGLAEWYKTGQIKRALLAIDEKWPAESPEDDYRTKAKCLEVMLDYVKKYPAENFKVIGAPDSPMIEQTFTLPTGLCLDDGESIEYGGIFDGLIEFAGAVYVLEHKSTSQLGPYYFEQFKPNNQVTGYIWASGKLTNLRVGGAFINAIGVYKASATRFERQVTNRSEEDIATWLHNLREWCQLIRNCETKGFWPLNTQSCTMYGRCEYHSVHTLSSQREQELRLENDYVKEAWSFEDRDG